MLKVGLSYFFTAPGQKLALSEYAKFAQKSGWSIQLKLELYELARNAIRQNSLQDFELIYNNLASNWQVFRPYNRDDCWSSQQIFEALQSDFTDFKLDSDLSLLNFPSNQKTSLLNSLMKLEHIKPNSSYPIMTVSKFLHFFNPLLFPIYDTEVIWKMVFTCFGSEYEDFCNFSALNRKADGAEFLFNYVSWASELIRSAHRDFMIVFGEWIDDEITPAYRRKIGPMSARNLFATAFEFTCIGAAKVNGY